MAIMTCPIEIREARGVRTLHFGSDWVQGAMRLSRPWDLELAYTREMMSALLLSPVWPDMPRRILQIGLGAASLTRFIFRHLPDARQTVVELEPVVVGAARQCFNLPMDEQRLCIEIADGATWVAASSEQFDLILIDGFDAEGRTGALESLRFYQHCSARLAAGGLLVCNLLSRSPNFLETCHAFDSVFQGNCRLLPQTPGGNVIALGALSPTTSLDAAALRERVVLLNQQMGLDLEPLVERLVVQEDGLPFAV